MAGELQSARHAVIPEFQVEIKEAVYTLKRDSQEPSGAMRITADGEGGEFQLYVRKEMLQGMEPKSGDIFWVRVSIDGTFEPRINVRALRPAVVEQQKRSA